MVGGMEGGPSKGQGCEGLEKVGLQRLWTVACEIASGLAWYRHLGNLRVGHRANTVIITVIIQL